MGEPVADRVGRDVTVRGQVQGVFFRDTMRRIARELDVAGWVRNASDGSVVAHVEGNADSVDQLLRFVRTGPPGASVQDVDERVADVEGLTGFRIR